MEIEHVTASEFLDRTHTAVANSAAKPAFKQFLDQLKNSPTTRQKLVFEFLVMASRLLESRGDPADAILWAVRWRTSVEEARLPEYLAQLEKLVIQYFGVSGGGISGRRGCPQVLTLAIALGAVRDTDKGRFRELMASLRHECSGSDHRLEILEEAVGLIIKDGSSQTL